MNCKTLIVRCLVVVSFLLPVQMLQAYDSNENTFLSDDNFFEKIAEGIAIVDCYTPSCSICRRFSFVFDNIAREWNSRYNFYKLLIPYAPSIVELYKIRTLTVIVFVNGHEIGRIEGYCTEDVLRTRIQKLLEPYYH